MGRARKDDELIVAALAGGATHAAAARLAGVSTRTIRRRLENPEFKSRVELARTEATAALAGELTRLGAKAVRVLDAALDDGDPRIQLRAAQLTLKSGREYRELYDLESRLVALEDASRDRPGAATTGQ